MEHMGNQYMSSLSVLINDYKGNRYKIHDSFYERINSILDRNGMIRGNAYDQMRSLFIDFFGSDAYFQGMWQLYLKIYGSKKENLDSLKEFMNFIDKLHIVTKGVNPRKSSSWNYLPIDEYKDSLSYLHSALTNTRFMIDQFGANFFKNEHYISDPFCSINGSNKEYIIELQGGAGAGAYSLNINLGSIDTHALYNKIYPLWRVGFDTITLEDKRFLRVVRTSSGYKKTDSKLSFEKIDKQFDQIPDYYFHGKNNNEQRNKKYETYFLIAGLYEVGYVSTDLRKKIDKILGDAVVAEYLSQSKQKLFYMDREQKKDILYKKFGGEVDTKIALHLAVVRIAKNAGFDGLMGLSNHGAYTIQGLSNTGGDGVDYTKLMKKMGMSSIQNNAYWLMNDGLQSKTFADFFGPNNVISKKEYELAGLIVEKFYEALQNSNISNIFTKQIACTEDDVSFYHKVHA